MARRRLSKRDIIVDEITKLREIYREKYGVSVFELQMPCIYHLSLTMEQMLEIMRHIVDTGENLYEGYEKYILKHPITLNDLKLRYAK